MVLFILSWLYVFIDGVLHPLILSNKALISGNSEEIKYWLIYWLTFILYLKLFFITTIFIGLSWRILNGFIFLLFVWLKLSEIKGKEFLFNKYLSPALTSLEKIEFEVLVRKNSFIVYNSILQLFSAICFFMKPCHLSRLLKEITIFSNFLAKRIKEDFDYLRNKQDIQEVMDKKDSASPTSATYALVDEIISEDEFLKSVENGQYIQEIIDEKKFCIDATTDTSVDEIKLKEEFLKYVENEQEIQEIMHEKISSIAKTTNTSIEEEKSKDEFLKSMENGQCLQEIIPDKRSSIVKDTDDTSVDKEVSKDEFLKSVEKEQDIYEIIDEKKPVSWHSEKTTDATVDEHDSDDEFFKSVGKFLELK